MFAFLHALSYPKRDKKKLGRKEAACFCDLRLDQNLFFMMSIGSPRGDTIWQPTQPQEPENFPKKGVESDH